MAWESMIRPMRTRIKPQLQHTPQPKTSTSTPTLTLTPNFHCRKTHPTLISNSLHTKKVGAVLNGLISLGLDYILVTASHVHRYLDYSICILIMVYVS